MRQNSAVVYNDILEFFLLEHFGRTSHFLAFLNILRNGFMKAKIYIICLKGTKRKNA